MKTHNNHRLITESTNMEEAIELFIKYTELQYGADEQVEQYKKLLRDIATGSWSFCGEFQVWRLQQQQGALESL